MNWSAVRMSEKGLMNFLAFVSLNYWEISGTCQELWAFLAGDEVREKMLALSELFHLMLVSLLLAPDPLPPTGVVSFLVHFICRDVPSEVRPGIHFCT